MNSPLDWQTGHLTMCGIVAVISEPAFLLSVKERTLRTKSEIQRMIDFCLCPTRFASPYLAAGFPAIRIWLRTGTDIIDGGTFIMAYSLAGDTIPAAGTPGQANCHGEAVAALAQQFGGMRRAAGTR
jgi:hypothetical protein